MYRLVVKPTACRQIRQLNPPVARRIVEELQQLRVNPRPPGVRKLHGVLHGYRLRVGDWRVLYTVDDEAKEVHVYRIKHRREAYR